jgi:hypothetical protein
MHPSAKQHRLPFFPLLLILVHQTGSGPSLSKVSATLFSFTHPLASANAAIIANPTSTAMETAATSNTCRPVLRVDSRKVKTTPVRIPISVAANAKVTKGTRKTLIGEISANNISVSIAGFIPIITLN